jgi:DNA-binding PadR family transcriptional regulator
MNQEHSLEILLLRQILAGGGSARIYEHIDPALYQRMLEKGWLTSEQVDRREAVYKITEAGRQAILAAQGKDRTQP